MDGYVRVSRKGDRERMYSPDDQAEQIMLWAARNGVTIDKVHVDIDWSGQTMVRPEFAEALRRVDEGLSQGLVVAMLDRFGRNSGGMIDAERRIRAAGGVLVNLDGEFDTSTPEGEYMFGIFSMNAQLKGRQIEHGWKRAHRNHVREGVPTRPIFGYRRRGDDGSGRHPKSLVPYPPEADHVAGIFRARARGTSFARIADDLDARGVKTSTGNNWTGGSVSALVRSRTYLGIVHFGELEPGVPLENRDAHEALVDEVLWRAAQLGGMRARPSSGTSLLTGLVRCAGCRYAMESSVALDRYRCGSKHAAGKCPAPASIRRRLLDEYVWDYMVRRTEDERLTLDARRLTDGSARAELEQQLADARLAEEAFLENLDAIVTLGKPRWNEQAARHRRRVEGLEQRLSELASDDLAEEEAPDWTALADAPFEVKQMALAHGIDVVFLRGQPGRGDAVGLDPSRVLVLERGQGPAKGEVPRRGPKGACALACVPFPFPTDLD